MADETESKMPLVVRVLAYILDHERSTGPVTPDHVLEEFHVTKSRATALLHGYGPKKQKYLASVGDNTYKMAPKGLKRLQEFGIDVSDFAADEYAEEEEEERTPLTTESARFFDIGFSALNVAKGIANTITDLVFRANWQDPKVVWQILKSTPLKGDIIRSWFLLWLQEQNQEIPDSLKEEAPELGEKDTDMLRERERKGPRRYNVYGDQIIEDAYGDFGFQEAMAIRGQNLSTGRHEPQPPLNQPPQDKPSETISAFSQAMMAFQSTMPKSDQNTELLLGILKTMVENPRDGANQDLLRQVERLTDKVERLSEPGPDPLAAVSGQMDLMARMFGFENASAMSAGLHKPPSGPTYEPKDFQELLHLQDRYRGWDREDASDKSKRDNTAAIRQTAANLATAIPAALRKMDQMIKEGRVPFTEPSPPPAATPQVREATRTPISSPDSVIPLPPPQVETVVCPNPNCNKPFTMLTEATEATCPHCGMYLVAPEAEAPPTPEVPTEAPLEAPQALPETPTEQERPMKEVLPDRGEVLGRLETEEDLPEMPEEEPPQGHNYGIEIGAANDPVAEIFVGIPENDEEPEKPKSRPKRKPKGGSDATN